MYLLSFHKKFSNFLSENIIVLWFESPLTGSVNIIQVKGKRIGYNKLFFYFFLKREIITKCYKKTIAFECQRKTPAHHGNESNCISSTTEFKIRLGFLLVCNKIIINFSLYACKQKK